ncbi:hypothetical protein G6M89_20720 [Natronolimnobius sp. AArcel1]|uniref:hypothetical protein n=1 Tax=Natronolimnobius sp. AArcel1 TaxID=1679093 RepID=UPI0013EB7834|nr:hypothetical protein [Natronolimnobius sp. AArcel1]NGM71386.1 hypothetical protein [Natronolimnobius sp. AArcel1]
MPIKTNSDPWLESDPPSRVGDLALEFLKENDNIAYTVNELAEELFNFNESEYTLDADHEYGRLIDLIKETRDMRRKEDLLTIVKIRLGDLKEKGLVESREVPSSDSDYWELVEPEIYYTYSGEN